MNLLLEEIRAAIWAVWNRRWIALGIAWLVCLLGWLVIALIPNSYESKTRIFVQTDNVLADQIGIGSGSRDRDIDRIRQTLASSVNLEKVVRSTALGDKVTSAGELEQAIALLEDEVKVVGEGKNIFQITVNIGRGDYSDRENAAIAREVAQSMIDIFREQNLSGSRDNMDKSLALMDEQIAEREAELAAAEQRRLVFETANPDLVGGSQAISQQLSATRSELRGVEADLAASQSALAALNGQLASTPRSLITANSGGPHAALAQAQANLAALRSRGLTAEHPDMVSATRTVAALRQQASGSSTRGTTNPAYASLQSMQVQRQATVQSLAARSAALRAEIGSISSSLEREPGATAEALRVNRDYDVLSKQYDDLVTDREQIRRAGQVKNDQSAVQFEVVDPPITPRSPAAPNRPLLLFGVLIVGLGAGAAVAFILSKIGSTFATSSQLERSLGLPVIGTISHTFTESGRAVRAKRLKYFMAGMGGLCVLFAVLMTLEFVQRGLIA